MIMRWPTRELKMWSYLLGRAVPSDRWTNRLQVPNLFGVEHDVSYKHTVTKDVK